MIKFRLSQSYPKMDAVHRKPSMKSVKSFMQVSKTKKSVIIKIIM